jgi:hypothetical protein
MNDTLAYSGQLVVCTCWCGMRHAVPTELRRHQEKQAEEGRDIDPVYCPLGHSHVPAGEPKIKRVERERERARNEAATRAAERDQAEASARAHKGAATKARKRAAAAVCPVPGCGRSFKQLRRHMETQHPDYDPAAGKEKAK